MTDASDRRSASRRRAGTADAADEPHILALSKTQASSLRDVLESIVSEVRGRVEGAGARVRVTLDVPEGQFVDADPALFRSAVEALEKEVDVARATHVLAVVSVPKTETGQVLSGHLSGLHIRNSGHGDVGDDTAALQGG